MEGPSPAPVCGFIGIGDQGGPIAKRMIDSGLDTVLWARRPESLEPFRGANVRFAGTIKELGQLAEHVGICVVNDDDVREVCSRLLPAMRPGSRVAIHSTIKPETCVEIDRDAAVHQVSLIDAPVSGGSPAATAGTLTLMLGGDPDVITLARPIFETFGTLIVRVGEVGAGQQVKLLNNSLLLAHIGLAHEVFSAGETLGIDRGALVEILLASSGRSFGLEVASRMKSPAAFQHGGNLLRKDLRLLCHVLGEDHPATLQLRNAAEPFLAAVAKEQSSAAVEAGENRSRT